MSKVKVVLTALIGLVAFIATGAVGRADPRPTGPDPSVERVSVERHGAAAGRHGATVRVTIRNRGDANFDALPGAQQVYVWSGASRMHTQRGQRSLALQLPFEGLAIGEERTLSGRVGWQPEPGVAIRRSYQAQIVYPAEQGHYGHNRRDRNLTNNSGVHSFITRD